MKRTAIALALVIMAGASLSTAVAKEKKKNSDYFQPSDRSYAFAAGAEYRDRICENSG